MHSEEAAGGDSAGVQAEQEQLLQIIKKETCYAGDPLCSCRR